MTGREIIVECKRCKHLYVSGLKGEAGRHRRYHDPLVNGFEWKSHRHKERILSSDSDFKIIGVSPSDPQFMKKRATDSAFFANRETRYDFGVYDSQRNRAVLALKAGRVVGVAVLKEFAQIAEVINFDKERVNAGAWVNKKCWGIYFFWVLDKWRRTRIPLKLIDEVSAVLKLPYQRIPLQAPFTDKGEKFFRKITGDRMVLGF